jgi:GntR family transcriptional regulator
VSACILARLARVLWTGQRAQIRLLIHQGALGVGDPLPTVRSLAVELGINANTVARVYRDLQAEGVPRLERGVGTFIAEGASQPVGRRDFQQLERKVLELIRLGRKAGMNAKELSQFIETRWEEAQNAQGSSKHRSGDHPRPDRGRDCR